MYKNQRFGRSAYAIIERMKGGKKARGFTVIETMIVLAVTGGLFLAIAVTLSGRQQRTQFEQGINDIRAQLQQVINDVGTGFYPSLTNFRCTAGASGPVMVTGTTNQGENTGCIFMGKAMQFGVNGTDPEQFLTYSVAGLQRTTTGDEVATYAQAQPRVISP
ncbi:MAG: type II secretion system protein, partial [Candidatus Saccharimonadales bacterium]